MQADKITLPNLIISRAVTKHIFFSPKRPIFLHACATCSELPSNISYMVSPVHGLVADYATNGNMLKMESFITIDLAKLVSTVGFANNKFKFTSLSLLLLCTNSTSPVCRCCCLHIQVYQCLSLLLLFTNSSSPTCLCCCFLQIQVYQRLSLLLLFTNSS